MLLCSGAHPGSLRSLSKQSRWRGSDLASYLRGPLGPASRALQSGMFFQSAITFSSQPSCCLVSHLVFPVRHNVFPVRHNVFQSAILFFSPSSCSSIRHLGFPVRHLVLQSAILLSSPSSCFSSPPSCFSSPP